MVLRSSPRVLLTRVCASPPPSWPSAAAGRSSIRLDTAAEARISCAPMLVIELIFCVKAGLFVSSETSSAA
jgi:hypothetical protein